MQTIRYEKQDNIGIITINRPEALNALNSAVFDELEPLVGEIERDATTGALIITGEGRSFVAGADIGEQCPMDLDAGRKWARRGSSVFRRLEKLEIPTIAAVNGFALGRRLRAGAGLRYHSGFREGQVRPARGGPGHHPRLLRYPAASPSGGHQQGQGADFLRQDDQGRRGQGHRSCQ